MPPIVAAKQSFTRTTATRQGATLHSLNALCAAHKGRYTTATKTQSGRAGKIIQLARVPLKLGICDIQRGLNFYEKR